MSAFLMYMAVVEKHVSRFVPTELGPAFVRQSPTYRLNACPFAMKDWAIANTSKISIATSNALSEKSRRLNSRRMSTLLSGVSRHQFGLLVIMQRPAFASSPYWALIGYWGFGVASL